MTKRELADAHVSRMEKLHNPIALANMTTIIMTDSFCAGFDAGAESQQNQPLAEGEKEEMIRKLISWGYHVSDIDQFKEMELERELQAEREKLRIAVEILTWYAEAGFTGDIWIDGKPLTWDLNKKARVALEKIKDYHDR